MRDSFAKELAMQRGKSGQGAIKKEKVCTFRLSVVFGTISSKKGD